MADQESCGGKKQGNEQQGQREEHEGVTAPANKRLPGHAPSEDARQEYLKETEGRR